MSLKNSLSQDKANGFTLIEAMVALTLMAIGLLGQMSLQVTSLEGNQSAYMRSQAVFLVNDIIDRMRANQAGVDLGSYSVIDTTATYSSPGCISNAVGCSPQKLAQEDLSEWTRNVKNLLANGSATVAGNASGEFTITVKWGKKLSRISEQNSKLYNQLVMTAKL